MALPRLDHWLRVSCVKHKLLLTSGCLRDPIGPADSCPPSSLFPPPRAPGTRHPTHCTFGDALAWLPQPPEQSRAQAGPPRAIGSNPSMAPQCPAGHPAPGERSPAPSGSTLRPEELAAPPGADKTPPSVSAAHPREGRRTGTGTLPTGAPDSQPIFCPPCRIFLNGQRQFEEHCGGHKHAKNKCEQIQILGWQYRCCQA